MTAQPNYIVTTGDFIAEWMDDEGINAAELSRRLGVTRKHVSELLHGKAPLSHNLALALERVTGVPARIWNQYESGYREDLARLEEIAQLEAQYEAAKAFPLRYLRQWSYIKAAGRDHAETVRELLAILGVASLDAFAVTWREGTVAYRRSAIARDHGEALATWLALAERHHDGLRDVPAFDRAALESLLPELRASTRDDPASAFRAASASLHGVGVVLCVIPAIPGLGIHGATRWVNGRPVIQLSLRGKTDDQLWFTIFHELGHVLRHGDKELYLADEDTGAEREADAFAAELLIPADQEYRLPRRRDLGAVRRLAEEWGIAPGIVLGRAQHLTNDFSWGHELKTRLAIEPPQQEEA